MIDPVFGGQYLAEDADVLALDGTIVVLAFMGGSTIKEWNAVPFFRKRTTVRFSTLRSRSEEYKTRLVESFRRCALPLFTTANSKGQKLQPVISAVVPLEQVAKGHMLLEANETAGKVILTMEDA